MNADGEPSVVEQRMKGRRRRRRHRQPGNGDAVVAELPAEVLSDMKVAAVSMDVRMSVDAQSGAAGGKRRKRKPWIPPTNDSNDDDNNTSADEDDNGNNDVTNQQLVPVVSRHHSAESVVTVASTVTAESYACSLYVTACPPAVCPGDAGASAGAYTAAEPRTVLVDVDTLHRAIADANPVGRFKVTHTDCGVIVSFDNESDADGLLRRTTQLSETLGGPIQVTKFSVSDSQYKKAVVLQNVPWSVAVQDICRALDIQRIQYESVERFKNNIRLTISNTKDYEKLLSKGLNFFNIARFFAIPDTWNSRRFVEQNSQNVFDPGSTTVVQCFRCQGFWHTATSCHQVPRCVRCGDSHALECCTRARNRPTCCHCSGPHHAAYRNCPVRAQLLNSLPVNLKLSGGQYQHRNDR